MKRTIFYAEDEMIQREMMVMMLSSDYDVHVFEDGMPLYTALQQARPDLVLTDGNMPGMRGYDVLKKARSEGYTGPAIIFSTPMSNRDQDDIAELRKQGVEFVRKPNVPELRGLIQKILSEDQGNTGTLATGTGSI